MGDYFLIISETTDLCGSSSATYRWTGRAGAWQTNSDYAIDGDWDTYAETGLHLDYMNLNTNNVTIPWSGCSTLANFSKVEVQGKQHLTNPGSGNHMLYRIVYQGDKYAQQSIPTSEVAGPAYTPWYDITNDTQFPSYGYWTWSDIKNDLGWQVRAWEDNPSCTYRFYEAQLRLTWYGISLLKPNTIGWGEGREVMPFNFWSGEIEIHDVAKESDTITLSGELPTMSYTSMHLLDDIAEADDEITIYGLDDDVFDDTFVIENFSYTVTPSSILWDLTLERT